VEDEDSGAHDESAEELFERAPVGYFSILGDGTILRVNQTLLDWTGYSREGFLGSRFLSLLTVPGRIYYETSVAPALQMRGAVREVAFDLACPGGASLPVLINFVHATDGPGRQTVIRASVFDATERRKYERELLAARRTAEQAVEVEHAARQAAERASRVKDDFLAIISHELRTPLSAILGWTALLRRIQSDDPQLERGLDVIERNAKVQTQLVDDLLDIGRVVSGKLRLNVQRVELVTAIEAAMETARFAAEAKSIRVQSVLDPSVVVTGDPGRLQQIFWNLLSNAVKFTPKGGTIAIVMKRVNSHAEISISDSGQGMSQEFLGKAFDRFRQADSADTRALTGLGLGLSIVKHLVEMHGGSVAAYSAGSNLGSTFTVQLPILLIHESSFASNVYPHEAVTPGPVIPITTSLKDITLVVVEDQGDSRELLQRLLNEAGAEVFAVGTAAEGLAAITTVRPHVLISDIGLPDLDGYELIRRVRMTAEGSSLPAIALTAYTRVADRTQALMAGFQAHLAKPVDARELLLAVSSLAGRLRTPGN
jgi:PAS domain S-box-containing protein